MTIDHLFAGSVCGAKVEWMRCRDHGADSHQVARSEA